MKMDSSIIFILLLNLFFITYEYKYYSINNVKKNDQKNLKIIGPNGAIIFVNESKYQATKFNRTDMQNFPKFRGLFITTDDQKSYWNCSLWTLENMNIIVKCLINESIPKNYRHLFILFSGELDYDNYVNVISTSINYYFYLDKKELNIPFIYSEPQRINLEENKDSYILNFRTNSYKAKRIVLISKSCNYSFFLLNDNAIDIKNNELICDISRKKIEEVLTNNMKLTLAFLDEDSRIFNFEFVCDIEVKYTKPKQKIYLMITEAFNNASEKGPFVGFKTNETDIGPLITDLFNIEIQGKYGLILVKCFLKKYDNKKDPILLFCENITKDYSFFIGT